jgi:hypothetical protein
MQYEITADEGTRGAVIGLEALEEVLSGFAARGIEAVALCGPLFMGESSNYPEPGYWYIDEDGEALDANER